MIMRTYLPVSDRELEHLHTRNQPESVEKIFSSEEGVDGDVRRVQQRELAGDAAAVVDGRRPERQRVELGRPDRPRLRLLLLHLLLAPGDDAGDHVHQEQVGEVGRAGDHALEQRAGAGERELDAVERQPGEAREPGEQRPLARLRRRRARELAVAEVEVGELGAGVDGAADAGEDAGLVGAGGAEGELERADALLRQRAEPVGGARAEPRADLDVEARHGRGAPGEHAGNGACGVEPAEPDVEARRRLPPPRPPARQAARADHLLQRQPRQDVVQDLRQQGQQNVRPGDVRRRRRRWQRRRRRRGG